MNWAHHAILKLQAGEQATINPRGPSMKGKVESGDTVVVAPIPWTECDKCKGEGRVYSPAPAMCDYCDDEVDCPDCVEGKVCLLEIGDIVLCKVKGAVYLHLITKIDGRAPDARYMISNNRGHDNGWVRLSGIYGVAISVAGRVVKVLPARTGK